MSTHESFRQIQYVCFCTEKYWYEKKEREKRSALSSAPQSTAAQNTHAPKYAVHNNNTTTILDLLVICVYLKYTMHDNKYYYLR